MRKTFRVFLYFSSWIAISLLCVVLNIINIDWTLTDTVNGIIIVIVLGILQGSVLEFPVQTLATLLVGGERRENKRAPSDHLTVILNYNLLATGKDDILECIETMYMAYVGNLSPNVSAVLVSATTDDELKEYELQIRDTYRAILYDDLYREGLAFAKGEYELVDPIHLHKVWSMYIDIDKEVFVNEYLEDICDRYAREFMVVHRVSRVLRKCGQYQDLMLLSEGEYEAYSYCDKEYYDKSARDHGEPLFHACEDASNIFERKFDYTLVLDADTGLPRGGVFDLLQIAAAHPDRGIIQPSIKLHCSSEDTIFMHLESMRQAIYEPMTNAMTALFDQSSYFGKALIKNRLYIDNVIGTKDNLIERVPVDVLSHDTFEAALLRPLYAGSTYLLEAPSHNYVTWNIRERRWNRGEILLAIYFWKNAFGKPMRWIQKKLQRSKFNKTKLRTESKLDFVTSYIAHSALRQMFMKPALLLYIILHINVHLRYRYASIIIVMFSVLIFPKFATCNRENYKFVILESIASILQFTPEALVGCVRIYRALYANISLNVKWIPQRAVEEEFKLSNPFVSSIKHLWGYSVFAVVTGVLVMLFLERAMLVLVMLATLFMLPLYTGFTTLSPGFKCCKRRKRRKLSDVYRDNVVNNSIATDKLGDIKTVASAEDLYNSAGKIPLSNSKTIVTDVHLERSLSNIDDLIDRTYDFGGSLATTSSALEANSENVSGASAESELILSPWLAVPPSGHLYDITNRACSELIESKYVTLINITSPRKKSQNKYVTLIKVKRPLQKSFQELFKDIKKSSSKSSNSGNSSGSSKKSKKMGKRHMTGMTENVEEEREINPDNGALCIRKDLSGKTYIYDPNMFRSVSTCSLHSDKSTRSSRERLFENMGVLKEFTSQY